MLKLFGTLFNPLIPVSSSVREIELLVTFHIFPFSLGEASFIFIWKFLSLFFSFLGFSNGWNRPQSQGFTRKGQGTTNQTYYQQLPNFLISISALIKLLFSNLSQLPTSIQTRCLPNIPVLLTYPNFYGHSQLSPYNDLLHQQVSSLPASHKQHQD